MLNIFYKRILQVIEYFRYDKLCKYVYIKYKFIELRIQRYNQHMN